MHCNNPIAKILLFYMFDTLYSSIEDLHTIPPFLSDQNGITWLPQIEFCSVL